MKDFKDKVAVITGAASGIGYAIAEKAVSEGAKVVLADVEEQALVKAEAELKEQGGSVLSVLTDVSRPEDIEEVAKQTLDAFGAAHLLFNNAGVGAGMSVWRSTIADWQWVLNVNLWGVIYGIKTFVPIMNEQDTECHIVNTSSLAGLVSFPGLGPYNITKFAVVTLSETLYHELALERSKIGVSVLCPGWVSTRIMESDRNRPSQLQNSPSEERRSREQVNRAAELRDMARNGTPPADIASAVFEAMREEKFYILPHPEANALIELRMDDILKGRNPTPRSGIGS